MDMTNAAFAFNRSKIDQLEPAQAAQFILAAAFKQVWITGVDERLRAVWSTTPSQVKFTPPVMGAE